MTSTDVVLYRATSTDLVPVERPQSKTREHPIVFVVFIVVVIAVIGSTAYSIVAGAR